MTEYKSKNPSALLILIGVVVVFVAIFIVMNMLKANSVKVRAPIATPTPTLAPIGKIDVKPSATPQTFSDWGLFRNGYGIMLPPEWKNTSDKGGTATFEPGQTIGHITSMAITVLSDAKAPPGQRFTTQKEFDEWSAVKGEVQGTIQKLDNVMIDGEPGLILLDTTGTEDKWTLITWVRKENRNLYITVNGKGAYDEVDVEIIRYLISSFSFIAPASTGKEK